MRPETLETALAWLDSDHSLISFDPGRVQVVSTSDRFVQYVSPIINGDIPAAIVAAVGEVWDQVNGKDQP